MQGLPGSGPDLVMHASLQPSEIEGVSTKFRSNFHNIQRRSLRRLGAFNMDKALVSITLSKYCKEINQYFIIGPTLVCLPCEMCVAGVAGADVGGAAGPANLEL